jgi:hypothetical protein
VRNFTLIAFGVLMMCSLAGVGMVLLAQSTIKPGHDSTIEYFEISVPNVDPAPGIERAQVLPASATAR